MFILQIVLANIVVPCVTSVAALLAARKISPAANLTAGRETGTGDVAAGEQSRTQAELPIHAHWPSQVLVAIAAAAAVIAAFALRNGFEAWSEESWLRIPAGVAVVALASLLPTSSLAAIAWLVRFALLALGAWIVFPTGESWDFLLPKRTEWIATMTLAAGVPWWCLSKLPSRVGGVLSLSLIACFAASAFLTAQSFLKVTEPIFAVSSLLGCVGIAAILFSRSHERVGRATLQGTAGVALFAFAAIVGNSQFNSYLGLTDRLTQFAMCTPALAAVATLPLLFAQRISAKSALAVCVPVCLILAAAIAAWTVSLTGTSESEW